MKCPLDSEDLVMSERGGVEIDYCPRCRGVWLDRGELDKIIDHMERGAASPAAPPPMSPSGYLPPPPLYNVDSRRDDPRRSDDRRGDDRRDRPRYGQPDYDDRRRAKKEGWLGELFDF